MKHIPDPRGGLGGQLGAINKRLGISLLDILLLYNCYIYWDRYRAFKCLGKVKKYLKHWLIGECRLSDKVSDDLWSFGGALLELKICWLLFIDVWCNPEVVSKNERLVFRREGEEFLNHTSEGIRETMTLYSFKMFLMCSLQMNSVMSVAFWVMLEPVFRNG